jgi:hypothetical protein
VIDHPRDSPRESGKLTPADIKVAGAQSISPVPAAASQRRLSAVVALAPLAMIG